MAVGRNGNGLPCVVVDLNTQSDFLSPSGACPVDNVQELIPALRHIVAWTKRNHAPVISSLNSHRTQEIDPDGPVHYCIDGTAGQRKLVFTVMGTAIKIEGDNTLAISIDLFQKYQQVIFRQRTKDLLSNPKADRFFTQLTAQRWILYGVAVETAVKSLALGLVARHRDVVVVADACGYWNQMEASLALRQMAAKGVQVITVADLLTEKLPRNNRYPLHSPTNGSGHRRNGTHQLRRMNGRFRKLA